MLVVPIPKSAGDWLFKGMQETDKVTPREWAHHVYVSYILLLEWISEN